MQGDNQSAVDGITTITITISLLRRKCDFERELKLNVTATTTVRLTLCLCYMQVLPQRVDREKAVVFFGTN